MAMTYDTPPESCTFGTHLVTEAHHSFSVPSSIQHSDQFQNGEVADKFDGDLLIVEQIGAFEDDAKGALSDLLADAIVNANDI